MYNSMQGFAGAQKASLEGPPPPAFLCVSPNKIRSSFDFDAHASLPRAIVIENAIKPNSLLWCCGGTVASRKLGGTTWAVQSWLILVLLYPTKEPKGNKEKPARRREQRYHMQTDIMQLDLGHQDNDTPPALLNMFINSTDTLQGRTFDQTVPTEWNDKPPLFDPPPVETKRRWGGLRSLGDPPKKEEDPVLLKGVSLCFLISHLFWLFVMSVLPRFYVPLTKLSKLDQSSLQSLLCQTRTRTKLYTDASEGHSATVAMCGVVVQYYPIISSTSGTEICA